VSNFVFEVEYSAPYGPAPTRYYWTNSYWFVVDGSTPSFNHQVFILQDRSIVAVASDVTRERYRVFNALDRVTPVVDVVNPQPGFRSVVSTLLNAVRVESVTEDGGRWYKRLRGLLTEHDCVNGQLSASVINYLQTFYIFGLSSDVVLTNYRGSRCGDLVISPRARMWQLRTGTKRRARRVLR
jgi:hypothetical protein